VAGDRTALRTGNGRVADVIVVSTDRDHLVFEFGIRAFPYGDDILRPAVLAPRANGEAERFAAIQNKRCRCSRHRISRLAGEYRTREFWRDINNRHRRIGTAALSTRTGGCCEFVYRKSSAKRIS